MTANSAVIRALVVAGVILLTACAAPVQTRLDDGTLVYRIECAGSARGLNYCFGKAGKSCGAEGFTVVDENGKTLTTSDASEADREAMVSLWASDQNSILVKCGT